MEEEEELPLEVAVEVLQVSLVCCTQAVFVFCKSIMYSVGDFA